MITVYYSRGPGYISIVSTGHSTSKELCAAECAIYMAATLAVESLAQAFPKEIRIEGMAHTEPTANLAKVQTQRAVFEGKWRIVRRAQKPKTRRKKKC